MYRPIAQTYMFPITFDVSMPPDTAPPVLSHGLPAGSLPAGTTSAILQVTTDEAATCRYALTADTSFSGDGQLVVVLPFGSGPRGERPEAALGVGRPVLRCP